MSPIHRYQLVWLLIGFAIIAIFARHYITQAKKTQPTSPPKQTTHPKPISKPSPHTSSKPARKYASSLSRRMAALGARPGDRVFIRIFKQERTLEVWIRPRRRRTYVLLKRYRICYFSGHLGPKLREGDRQAPEGFYKVYRHSLNPHSRNHLAFNLGFPNAYDRAHGRTGSYLMVHGGCRSIGCYAMTDRYIDEIYRLVEAALLHGQRFVQVHCFPFRLTRKRLRRYRRHRWYRFWKELKRGYDYFERHRRPPRITVRNGRYIVR